MDTGRDNWLREAAELAWDLSEFPVKINIEVNKIFITISAHIMGGRSVYSKSVAYKDLSRAKINVIKEAVEEVATVTKRMLGASN